MKKVITLVVVALFTSAAFAQEPTPATPSAPAATPAAPAKVQEPKKDVAPDTKMENKSDKKMATNAPAATHHDYYMMKEGKLMHFSGEKMQAQKSVVKFNNGTSMTADGTITSKEGKTSKLENGQCITTAGVIGDCAKMTKESVPADKMAPTQK